MSQVACWNTVHTPLLGTCEALNASRSCCLSKRMILVIPNQGAGSQVLLEDHYLILCSVLSYSVSADTFSSQALLRFFLLQNVL